MERNYRQKWARDIAKKALGEGLRVWLARDGEGDYGCFCGPDGKRVVSFDISLLRASFSGNYGPASTHSGTGWQITTDEPDKLASLLSAWPFQGCKFEYFTTIEQHLKTYGASSRYREMTPADFEPQGTLQP